MTKFIKLSRKKLNKIKHESRTKQYEKQTPRRILAREIIRKYEGLLDAKK